MSLSDRQAAASRQGAAWEDTVAVTLQIEGWTIVDRKWRHPEIDIEIDIVADDPLGVRWWIECKGSWESTRNGLERTDTLKKAICNGALLRLAADAKPYMIVTSHPPRDTGVGASWIRRAIQAGYVNATRIIRLA